MQKKEQNAVRKNKNFLFLTIIILALLVIIFLYNFVSKNEIEPVLSSREMMSTLVTQKIYSDEKESAKKAIDEVFLKIAEMEERYSLFIESSDISRINEKAGIDYVKVEKAVFDLIKRSKEYSKESSGDFDITIAPVTKAWGITSLSPKVVPVEQREKLIELVDYNKILLDEENHSIMLQEKGMELDLGAIAKGEACTVSKEIYEKYNFQGVLLSVGGNILAIGNGNKKDSGFKIAIRDPGKKETGILGVLSITDTTISTSGSYERFFEKDGESYHHIFDPKTAYPSDSDLISVSIVAKDGAYAEYLSTNLFIKGKDYLDKLMDDGQEKNYEIIAVDKEKNVYISKSLQGKFIPEEGTKYIYVFK